MCCEHRAHHQHNIIHDRKTVLRNPFWGELVWGLIYAVLTYVLGIRFLAISSHSIVRNVSASSAMSRYAAYSESESPEPIVMGVRISAPLSRRTCTVSVSSLQTAAHNGVNLVVGTEQ
ncbi:hypothetical protein K440DRAFT_32040 [Wilcoxina mikolae CBS 423.85]|nr:hypothetical protein K440DRAFT_32040 [Wilcoxina mikolae CBS 423.85]